MERTICIIIMMLAVGGSATSSAADAENDCPPGLVRYRTSGDCKPATPAKTYAECLRNGRAMGYSAASAESYCKTKFAH
jgi:hypothetical protein